MFTSAVGGSLHVNLSGIDRTDGHLQVGLASCITSLSCDSKTGAGLTRYMAKSCAFAPHSTGSQGKQAALKGLQLR